MYAQVLPLLKGLGLKGLGLKGLGILPAAAGLGFFTLAGMTAPLHANPEDCLNDAILVFDASGSMASADYTGNASRIHIVRSAVAQVVPRVAKQRNLGLIVYGPRPGPLNSCTNIELMVEPGPDNGQRILDALSDILPNGRTPLTLAVREAAKVLKYKEKSAVIVLLTDGEETCGEDPCALAATLNAEAVDVKVHVIDYKLRGSVSWQGTFVTRCLADKTGGTYVAPNSTEDLVRALSQTLECPQITQSDPSGASPER